MSKFGKRKNRKLTREKLDELLGKTFCDKEQAVKQVNELLKQKVQESEVKE